VPKGRCRLCGVESELQLSHVLPAFEIRWLRESSGSGHIRTAMSPNLRVQDGKNITGCASHAKVCWVSQKLPSLGNCFTPTLIMNRLSSIMVRGFYAFAFHCHGESYCSTKTKLPCKGTRLRLSHDSMRLSQPGEHSCSVRSQILAPFSSTYSP
jgi:hypothetical protein